MGALSLLCRFIDWDLRRSPGTSPASFTLVVGVLPWLPVILIQQQASTPIITFAVAGVIAFDAAWFALVGWRAWRLVRQCAARGDRIYDRKGKYLLPPEYAHTESATKARSRRKKKG